MIHAMTKRICVILLAAMCAVVAPQMDVQRQCRGRFRVSVTRLARRCDQIGIADLRVE